MLYIHIASAVSVLAVIVIQIVIRKKKNKFMFFVITSIVFAIIVSLSYNFLFYYDSDTVLCEFSSEIGVTIKLPNKTTGHDRHGPFFVSSKSTDELMETVKQQYPNAFYPYDHEKNFETEEKFYIPYKGCLFEIEEYKTSSYFGRRRFHYMMGVSTIEYKAEVNGKKKPVLFPIAHTLRSNHTPSDIEKGIYAVNSNFSEIKYIYSRYPGVEFGKNTVKFDKNRSIVYKDGMIYLKYQE